MVPKSLPSITLAACCLYAVNGIAHNSASAQPPKYPCGFYLEETALDSDGNPKKVWTPIPEGVDDQGNPRGHKKKITIGGTDKEGPKPLTAGILCGGVCEKDAAGCEQACIHTAIFDTAGAGADTIHYCDCEKVAPPTPVAQSATDQSAQPATVNSSQTSALQHGE